MAQKLSTQPYKGSRDFYPADFRIREYIFGIWRDVCKSYGYEEYDGPFLESFDLYAAKSGQELVNEQLYSFTDKGGRKVAIRPEMTPTLARMVAAKYKELERPIKWFCIPNFWRYEKPQRGRGREFFQLNVDILGVEGPEADFEVLSIAIDIMKKTGAKEGMFELRINDRRLMNQLYSDLGLNDSQISTLNKNLDKKLELPEFLKNPQEILNKLDKQGNAGAKSINFVLEAAKKAGIAVFIKFDPTIVRGLDYYTGMVFEQYDLTPGNTRSMFGGGRYDDLLNIFIDEKIPATGLAIGDVTFLNFLESWKLLPDLSATTDYLVTVWPSEDKKFMEASQKTVEKLRADGKSAEIWLDSSTKLEKQLKYADRKGIQNAVIIGENELSQGKVTIKNLKTQKQETTTLD